jgi:hypothetical protein
VTHNQHIIGNNADLTWDSLFFGVDNRFAAQLQASSNWITFEQEGNPNSFPADTVSVIDPSPGVNGPEFPNTRNSRLTDAAPLFRPPHLTGTSGMNSYCAGLFSSSGSLAMLTAIRRASSRVMRCAADRRPGSSSK